MKKKIIIYVTALLLMLALLLYGVIILRGASYYLISLGIILIGLTAGLIAFEGGRPSAGYLTCIVIFTAIAVASRCLFSPLPQVKPVAAVVILAGVALGAEAGFITGALAMFLSNFYFMQGAWTPFQMFAMGLIGFFAGVIFHKIEKTKLIICLASLYGFFSVLIIYGLIVDVNTVYYTLGESVTREGVLTVYIAGVPFDIIFAVTTAVIILVFTPFFVKKWERIRKKFVL